MKNSKARDIIIQFSGGLIFAAALLFVVNPVLANLPCENIEVIVRFAKYSAVISTAVVFVLIALGKILILTGRCFKMWWISLYLAVLLMGLSFAIVVAANGLVDDIA